MLDIRFKVMLGNNKVLTKTITGPHPVGVSFVFKTNLDDFEEVEVKSNDGNVRWLHDEQIFEVWYSAFYVEEVWLAAGFTKVLG